MSGHTTLEEVQTNPRDHHAVKAWTSLPHAHLSPDRISVLYDERKTQVYKLHVDGKSRSSVIAKRCRRQSALLEKKLYEQVLPHLPVVGLRYYGSVDEPAGEFCWLFLEEVRGKQFSAASEDHRQLAAQWVGAVHAAATDVPAAATLSDRSAEYYLEQLRMARAEMEQGLANPVLTANSRHVKLVTEMLSQLDSLQRQWNEIADYCNSMPRTLVHGDLMVKNVRVRRTRGQSRLLVMDWETSGWGVPGIDIAQLGGRMSISPELMLYHSLIQKRWPSIGIHEVQRLADYGGIFRLICAIRWATRDLPTHWVDDGIDDLRCYQTRLTQHLK